METFVVVTDLCGREPSYCVPLSALDEAIVERRLPECGFVYVEETRMGFAPGHTVREVELPKEAIVLYQANWGPVTAIQASACRKALKRVYPDKQIILT